MYEYLTSSEGLDERTGLKTLYLQNSFLQVHHHVCVYVCVYCMCMYEYLTSLEGLCKQSGLKTLYLQNSFLQVYHHLSVYAYGFMYIFMHEDPSLTSRHCTYRTISCRYITLVCMCMDLCIYSCMRTLPRPQDTVPTEQFLAGTSLFVCMCMDLCILARPQDTVSIQQCISFVCMCMDLCIYSCMRTLA
jgi:hypothetical protein